MTTHTHTVLYGTVHEEPIDLSTNSKKVVKRLGFCSAVFRLTPPQMKRNYRTVLYNNSSVRQGTSVRMRHPPLICYETCLANTTAQALNTMVAVQHVTSSDSSVGVTNDAYECHNFIVLETVPEGCPTSVTPIKYHTPD